MMERRFFVVAVVMAFLCSNVLQADIIYEVIDLGTLGGDRIMRKHQKGKLLWPKTS
jgi:hypothetical protein